MKCEVVRDLIPLVIDDVASEESRNLVGEHLETCEACRAYRDGMAAQLEKLGITAAGAVLTDADDKFLRAYYGKKKRKASGKRK